MNDQQKKTFGWIAAIAAVAFAMSGKPSAPVVVEPLPATSLDLSAAFVPAAGKTVTASEQRTHAGELRQIFGIVADRVEWDGTRAGDVRIFRTGAAIDDFIVTAREFYTRGVPYRDLYPTLGQAVGKHLKERLGEQTAGSLGDDTRRQWVAALREVQAACAKVEGG